MALLRMQLLAVAALAACGIACSLAARQQGPRGAAFAAASHVPNRVGPSARPRRSTPSIVQNAYFASASQEKTSGLAMASTLGLVAAAVAGLCARSSVLDHRRAQKASRCSAAHGSVLARRATFPAGHWDPCGSSHHTPDDEIAAFKHRNSLATATEAAKDAQNAFANVEVKDGETLTHGLISMLAGSGCISPFLAARLQGQSNDRFTTVAPMQTLAPTNTQRLRTEVLNGRIALMAFLGMLEALPQASHLAV
mmetsp:Transcript_37659/g.95362  ORF Transcript_37659/g.95362 Transcript_37659/m.95362 type:complete len:253 (-) Transcript_37659:131-889(-)